MKNKKYILLSLLFPLLYLAPAWAQVRDAEAYISSNKESAVNAMQTYGIPASIILAVAMHESANGTSKVAQHLNNHFGIKGPNNSQTINSSYKEYESIEESYDDFIHYLQGKKQFRSLFDRYSAFDYTNWAYGIMHGGYAQSKTWANQVINLIKKHQLFRFDEADESMSSASKHKAGQTTNKLYTVKKGDTLSAIAKQSKLSIQRLKELNRLANSKLRIGQQLVIMD